MTPNEYQEECNRTVMSNAEQAHKIIAALEISPKLSQIIVAGGKLCSESGEINDAICKHISYGQPLDKDNLFEECGDLLWYISLILTNIDRTIEDAMQHNVDKLRIRYPEKFTEEHAAKRLDKIDYLSNKYRCPACGSLDHTICGGEF